MAGIRRRKYLMRNGAQGKYVFYYLIFFFFGLLAFSGMFAYVSAETISIDYHGDMVVADSTPRVLAPRLALVLLLGVVAGCPLFFLVTRFTHRVAGAAYRLEEDLARMTKGDLRFPVKLRDTDELQDIAGEVNRFREMLVAGIIDLEMWLDASDEALMREDIDGAKRINTAIRGVLGSVQTQAGN